MRQLPSGASSDILPMMKHLLTWTVLLAAIFGLACAPSKQAPVERATEEEPYDVRSEGEIPEAEKVAPEADVEEAAVEEAPLEVDEGEVRIDSTRVRPPTVDGFRVQVFASIDAEAAEKARADAERRTKMFTYIQVIDRMYKVRVGDCLTREDAETVLGRVKAAGYTDAWIVASPVIPPPDKDAEEMH